MKKIFNIVKKIITTILVIVIVLFASTVILQRAFGGNAEFLSYKIYTVVTGSMSPEYNIGDVIICKKVDLDTLKVGDDITYIGKEDSLNDKIITHRIIRIRNDENGVKLFQTKGIAAQLPDPEITGDQIYGKVLKRLVCLSWFYKKASTTSGFFLLIFLPILIIISSEILSLMIEKYEEKRIKKGN